jgi:hypothetical protein
MEWYNFDFKAWLSEQVDQDPALDAMQSAMAHAATIEDLGSFEIVLAGDVADQAALGVSEKEWLVATFSGNNKILQGALRGEGIMQDRQAVALERLELAITKLKAHGFWPW